MSAREIASRARIFLLLCALAVLGLFVANAAAERNQDGNLIVTLDGGISPRALPRHRAAPVAVHLAGRVQTSDEAPLPRVNWIRLELAWRGVLDTRGLAVCPRSRLIGATARAAIERCGNARVGEGSLAAMVVVPNQPPFDVDARVVAFNGRTKAGRHAVLVHANSLSPPVAFTIPFSVHHRRGTFRTALIALIRRSVGPWPRVASFEIDVSHSFSHDGEHRSYLKASCPIPKTFTAGFLSFARATYHFADGREVKVEAVRSCRAR